MKCEQKGSVRPPERWDRRASHKATATGHTAHIPYLLSFLRASKDKRLDTGRAGGLAESRIRVNSTNGLGRSHS